MPLKDPKDWKIVGKPLTRLDTADKTTGTQVYGIDLKLPGMLNAAIKDCPVFGGKVKSFDAATVPGDARREEGGAGRRQRRGGGRRHLVAGQDRARRAADRLGRRRRTPRRQQRAIAAMLKAGLDADRGRGRQQQRRRAGGARRRRRARSRRCTPTRTRTTPRMEPMNATARWTPTRCEVWTPTQNGEAALAATAEAAGLPPAQCEVYKIHLGGGFGRRGACTTRCARRWPSPSRCPARRSS